MSDITSDSELSNICKDLLKDSKQWAVFGYKEGDLEKIVTLSSGQGNLSSIESLLPENGVVYVLFGLSFKEDEASAALKKWLLITYVGLKTKPTLKARTTVHRNRLFGQCQRHLPLTGEFQAQGRDELTSSALLEKVAGSRAANLSQTSATAAASAASSAAAPSSKPTNISFALANEAAIKEACEALRTGALNYLLLGYAAGSDALQLTTQGRGSVGTELAAHLRSDSTAFALVSVHAAGDDGTEMSFAKRVLVLWIGEKAPAVERARASQHKLPLHQTLQGWVALSAEFQATQLDELSDASLVAKVFGAAADTAQGRDQAELRRAALQDAAKRKPAEKPVTPARASPTKPPAERSGPKAAARKAPAANAPALSVQFADAEGSVGAIQRVRERGAGHWAVWAYDSAAAATAASHSLLLRAEGSRGVPELVTHAPTDAVVFALLASTAVDGEYTTVKNVLLSFVGDAVKPVVKARSAQQRVELHQLINAHLPLAGQLQVSGSAERDSLSDREIHIKLTGSRVHNDTSATTTTAAAAASSTSSPGAHTDMHLVDENAAQAALEDLRKEQCEWVLFGYAAGSEKVALLGKGSGGLTSLRAQLHDGELAYAALRVSQEDPEREGKEFGYKTNKILFVSWVGPNVKPLVKAKSSQHRMALYRFIRQHVAVAAEFQALAKEELTDEQINIKLTSSRQKAQ